MARRARDVVQPWSIACQELDDERERARLARRRMIAVIPEESTINIEEHVDNILKTIHDSIYRTEGSK